MYKKLVVCFQWILGCSVTGEGTICSIAELECCLEKHLYKKLWFQDGFSTYKCNNGKNRKVYKELTAIMAPGLLSDVFPAENGFYI